MFVGLGASFGPVGFCAMDGLGRRTGFGATGGEVGVFEGEKSGEVSWDKLFETGDVLSSPPLFEESKCEAMGLPVRGEVDSWGWGVKKDIAETDFSIFGGWQRVANFAFKRQNWKIRFLCKHDISCNYFKCYVTTQDPWKLISSK